MAILRGQADPVHRDTVDLRIPVIDRLISADLLQAQEAEVLGL